MSSTAANSDNFPLAAKVINSSIAGFIGTCTVYPFDLVKVRLQRQKTGPQGEVLYNNIIDCFRKTVKYEGVQGLYRGIGLVALISTPEKALKLIINDAFLHMLQTEEKIVTLPRRVLSGMLSGIVQDFLTNPIELVKIQLQLAGQQQLGAKIASRPVPDITYRSVLKNLTQTKSLSVFYKGMVPTLVRDVSFNGIYFPMFYFLNNAGPRSQNSLVKDQTAPWFTFVSGIVAGGITALILTPVDVLKTRVQAELGKRRNAWDMIVLTYEIGRYEGFRALFKGGACRLMVISPMYGILQVIYLYGIGERLIAFYSETQ